MENEKILNVEIITPQKTVFNGKAVSVTVPGSYSPFQILYNHAPIVSALDIGIVKLVDTDNNNKYFATSSGFAEVRKNLVSILVDNAEDGDSINIIDAKKYLDISKETLNKSETKSNDILLKEVKFAEFVLKAAERSKE